MYGSQNLTNPLNYIGVYPCPICRVGRVQTMPLMEVMACDSCHHIFLVDLEKQLLKMTDRHPPLTWHWNGRNWIGGDLEGLESRWVYWLLAAAFILLPTTLISLAVYTFPPDPNSHLAWFPIAWIGLTFLSHLVLILWLVMEFYQFPLLVYLRVRMQQQPNR